MKKLLKNKWAGAVGIVVIIGGIYYSGAWKPAELETGVTIQVPLFVEEGEKIKVDTRTGEYSGRV